MHLLSSRLLLLLLSLSSMLCLARHDDGSLGWGRDSTSLPLGALQILWITESGGESLAYGDNRMDAVSHMLGLLHMTGTK